MSAQREAVVAALQRERAAMALHGKTARVEAIDAELARLGVEAPAAPVQAETRRRRTAAAD